MNNDFDRPEIAELVPVTARRVLDVGCGTGRLGERLRARQECHVTGVDVDAEALRTALEAGRLDVGIEGDIEAILADPAHQLAQEPYDCIVLADVLEHLRAPLDVLRGLRRLFTADGTVVVSVPNARHWSVLLQLAEGGFTYGDAGILDRSHLRFFTAREIQVLLDAAGFDITRQQAVPGPGYEDWVNGGKPGHCRVGRLEVHDLTEDDAFQFQVYQWLLAARPRPEHGYGLTSIVIPVLNNLQLTAQCLQAVWQHTQEPIEIIVIDNGSTDGTADWLARDRRLRVVTNPENRGFPAACNQGIAAATGEQVLILNNDVVVSPGWLRRLLEALYSEPAVGIVGPRSNRVSGAQALRVGYRRIEELDRWSWWWSTLRRGERIPVDRLVGFCMLIRRSVLTDVGEFDEQFGIGNYEDDDFCRRAQQAGYELRIANDCVVHHYGGATFASEGIDYAALMSRNRALYEAKWVGALQ